ncbi:MAG: glycosyltransferase family 9 protein [Verrucomicrobiia bacterium]
MSSAPARRPLKPDRELQSLLKGDGYGARLLIIKPSSFGDVVHALPVLESLKGRYPRAVCGWVIKPEWSPLLEGHPHLEQVIPFPIQHFRGVAAAGRFVQWTREVLRSFGATVAIDLQGLLRSGLVAATSGAALRLGGSDARECATRFYSKVVTVNRDDHAVVRYLRIASVLDIQSDADRIGCWLPEGEMPASFEVTERPFVVLHPWARGTGKSLPDAVIQAMVDIWGHERIMVVGRCLSPPDLPGRTGLLVNRTDLRQLIAVLRSADCVVSVDSGPLHLAAALGRRVLGIYTWSDPAKVGPWSLHARIWRSGRIMTMREIREGASVPPPGPPPAIMDVEPILRWVREATAAEISS